MLMCEDIRIGYNYGVEVRGVVLYNGSDGVVITRFGVVLCGVV